MSLPRKKNKYMSMYKYPGICKIVCVMVVSLFFLLGCKEEPPKPPPKPKVIRKKITARPPKAETTIAVAETNDDKKIEIEKPDEDNKEIIIADAENKTNIEDIKPEKDAPSVKAKPDKEVKITDLSKKMDSSKPDNETSEKPDSEIASISDITLNNESDKYIAYNPKGKIDPFAPLFKEDNKKDPVEEKSDKPKIPPRPLTPLEKLDLGQLKLVGVISAESGNKALVEEASGKGYIIIKGTYIGIHSGKVVDILKDRIIVEEEDKDMLGQTSIRKRELKFQRPAGDDYYEM